MALQEWLIVSLLVFVGICCLRYLGGEGDHGKTSGDHLSGREWRHCHACKTHRFYSLYVPIASRWPHVDKHVHHGMVSGRMKLAIPRLTGDSAMRRAGSIRSHRSRCRAMAEKYLPDRSDRGITINNVSGVAGVSNHATLVGRSRGPERQRGADRLIDSYEATTGPAPCHGEDAIDPQEPRPSTPEPQLIGTLAPTAWILTPSGGWIGWWSAMASSSLRV